MTTMSLKRPNAANPAIAPAFLDGCHWRMLITRQFGLPHPSTTPAAVSMKTMFQFCPLNLALLVTNSFVLGGCIILLMLGRGSGPLVLLTVGALGMLVSKLRRAYGRTQASGSSASEGEGSKS